MCKLLILLVADVTISSGIEEQVADGSDQGVNAKGNHCGPEVSAGSAGVAFGLQAGMVDDEAADPTQEESQQKTNNVIGIHGCILLSIITGFIFYPSFRLFHVLYRFLS